MYGGSVARIFLEIDITEASYLFLPSTWITAICSELRKYLKNSASIEVGNVLEANHLETAICAW